MFRTVLLTILLAMAASLQPLAAQSGEAERLDATIQAALDALYGCCVDHSDEEKQSKVRAVIEKDYDLTVIIRRAIGRNWRLLKPDEQEQVLELVKQLVVKAYVKGMDGVARPEIVLGEVVEISDKRIEIPSTIRLEGKSIEVLYRLGRMPSGWQIYDIVAENISVVSNYRQQIDDHFRKGTGAGLITKLEELLSKDDLDENVEL